MTDEQMLPVEPVSTVTPAEPIVTTPAAVEPLDAETLQMRAAQLLNHGETRSRATEILQQQGAKGSDAGHAVESAHRLLSQHHQAEVPDSSDVVRGVAGALAAAVIAGVIWGVIVWQTHYEIAFAAIGVGWLVGRGMAIATGHKRARQLQVIAVLASVLGIMIGKYMTLYFVLKDQYDGVKLFDSRIIDLIRNDPGTVFSLIDILFFVIAVVYAARQLAPTTSKFQRDGV